MATDASALMNRGRTITLLDGREATVHFDLEAIAQLEDDFGSLGDWQDTLLKIRDEQMKAKVARPLVKMLKAGLLHDPSMRDAAFDPQRLEDYFAAVMGAAEEAFPKAVTTTEQTSPTSSVIDVNTSDSNGETSTTAAQSGSVVPIVSSGV